MSAVEAESGFERPQQARKVALRAISGDAAGRLASESDRKMIEATNAAVELFAAKWKVDLIYLLAAGVNRHGRLQDHLLVSKKVLTDALRSLQRDGLVQRQVFDESPVRVEYSLTPLGRSLTAPLFELSEWSERYFRHVREARADDDGAKRLEPATVEPPPRFTAWFQVQGDRRVA